MKWHNMSFADYLEKLSHLLNEAYARQDFEEYRRLLGCLNDTLKDHAEKAGCEWVKK